VIHLKRAIWIILIQDYVVKPQRNVGNDFGGGRLRHDKMMIRWKDATIKQNKMKGENDNERMITIDVKELW